MSAPLTLITGAASGLGRATAERCAAAGHSVLMLDVNDADGTAIAADLGARYRHCDVGSDWQALIDDLDAPLTRVYLNAGIQIAPAAAPLEEYRLLAATTERYRRMMAVNVDGVVFGLRACVPVMPEGSAIVVTASLAGLVPYAIDPLYAMSKHAVVGLVRSVAEELGERGIRINAICPGGVDTAIIPHQQRGGEMMQPDELAMEVMRLFDAERSGETWAKVRAGRDAHVIHPPGRRYREQQAEADKQR